MTQLENLPRPLASILSDITRSIDAGLYYPALVVALTIPEICVALCWDRDMMVREKHYAAFIDEYTTEGSLPRIGLDGIACYRLRCGVIHRGRAGGHPKFPTSHVIFTVPGGGARLHAFTIEAGEKSATMLDLSSFCSAMIHAAIAWYDRHQTHQKVVENMPNLLSWRPLGVFPFVEGRGVVASGV
jgi:hypothetical protein